MRYIFFLYLIFFVVIAQAQNKAGTLDKTFGTNGKVLTSSVTGYLLCGAIAAQGDGSIIAVGSVSFIDSDTDDFFALKYSSDGIQDSSFGNKGVAAAKGAGYGQAVAIQPDNKIVIAGYDVDLFGPYYITIAHLNADGSIDSSFGTNGIIKTRAGENGHAIAIQPDGKILVTGINRASIVTLRYLQDGTPDASFGSNGAVETNLGGSANAGNAISVQPDGKIVVAGDRGRRHTARSL